MRFTVKQQGVLIASAAMALFGLLAASPAFADSATVDQCHNHNADSSVICTGSTKWCGGTCQVPPTPTATQDMYPSCTSCTTVCAPATPCNYPTCSAASSTAGVTSCSGGSCPANGGVYTDQCSSSYGCPSGKTLCASPLSCATTLSCPAGFTFDPCANGGTGACTSPYVVLSPGSQQTGNITVSGNVTSGGDVYLSSGKALRIDGSGTSTLNIGNWGGGASGLTVNVGASTLGTKLKLDGIGVDFNINRVSGSFMNRIIFSTANVNDWQVGQGVGGPGFAIKHITSPPDVGTTPIYIDNVTENIGFNNQNPSTTLDLTGALTMRGVGGPGVSPANQGRIFFDPGTQKFRVSENGTAFADLVNTSGVTGSGTANYVPKFTSASAVGNSLIFDNGSSVGIGTASPSASVKLHVASGGIGLDNGQGIWSKSAGGTMSNLMYLDGSDKLHIRGLVGGFEIDDSGGNSKVFMANSGNVAIGTASASSTLSVGGAGQAGTAIYGIGTTRGVLGSYNDSTTWGSLGNNISGSLYGLYTRGADAGVYAYSGSTTAILAGTAYAGYFSGSVGINTLTPGANLEVDHNGGSVYGVALKLNQNVIGNSDGPKIEFYKTMAASTNWTAGILNGVNVGTFGISSGAGTGGFGTPRLAIDTAGGVAMGTYAGANVPPANGLIVSGKVGIGTPTPATSCANCALSVIGDSTGNAIYASTTSTYSLWANSTGTGAIAITGSSGYAINSTHTGTSYLAGSLGIGTAASYKLHVIDTGNAGLRVQTNAAGGTVASFGGNGDFMIDASGIAGGRFTVKESGSVGIGTASPGARLHVSAGDSSFALFGPNSSWGGKLFVGAGPNQAAALTAQVLSSDGNLHLDPASGHNIYLGYYQARDIYMDTNGGNVSMGNSASSLTIGGVVNCIQGTCPSNNAIRMTPNFHLNSGAGYAVIANWDNGTTGGAQTFRVGNGAGGGDVFYVNADGYTYSGGNLSAANVNARAGVSAVNGITSNTGFISSGGYADIKQYLAGNGTVAICGQSWTWRGYTFSGDGCYDTGMFSDSDGILRFYANGTLRQTYTMAGTFAYNSSEYSDKRLKDDVQPYIDGLEQLRKINTVSFTFNGLGASPKGVKSYGVIAQEVQKVIPYAVTSTPTKMRPEDIENTDVLAVDMQVLSLLSINAIKELDAELQRTKAENLDLRARIEALEAKMR